MLPDELQEMKLESASAFGDEPFGAMAGQPSPTTTESASDQTSTCLLSVGVGSSTATPTPSACETAMWEEWTQGTSAGDEASTSNFLPDLAGRLSFQPSDMLATWMSSFHPLAPSSLNPDLVVDVVTAGLLDPSDMVVDSTAEFPLAFEKAPSHRHLRRAGAGTLGPLSPSSPLAIQNGLLNPLGDPWDSCPQWSTVTSTGQTSYDNYGHGTRRIRSPSPSFLPDHSSAAIDHLENSSSTCRYRPRHTDIFIGPNGTFESTPGGWTPQLMYDAISETTTVGSSVTPLKLMASLREAGEATSSEVCVESQTGQTEIDLDMLRDRIRTVISVEPPSQGGSSGTMSSMRADCNRAGAESTSMTTTRTTQVVWPGKHRLELVEVIDREEDMKSSSPPLLKRPKITTVEQAKALQWSDQTLRGAELRSYYCPRSSSLSAAAAAEAMDIIAIGPALNTNGKPRARRGSATDPQSVYARHRREKINERLKNLQNLVPNGAKVDIVTMLDEAIHYVKFLQNQVELLKSDDYWRYATPNNYNGLDLSSLCPHWRDLESSAS